MADTDRRTKVLDIETTVSTLVADVTDSLWVGGMHMHNVPMALVRECIRQGKRFETLYAAPSASLAADLLIGAGLVDRVVCGYIGFEHLGLAPAFRRAAEEGSPIRITEADSGSLVLALQAGAWDQPFAVLPPGIEQTSLVKPSPHFYREIEDPFNGTTHFAVEAVRPALALVHCQQADQFGNGIFKGSRFVDRLLGLAADRVIMQVEGLVDNDQILKYPLQTGMPGFRADAVVQVNFGCHPTSSHRYYNYDDVHLRLYLQAASTDEGFRTYLDEYVMQPVDQEDYMRRVQNQDWGAITGEVP